MYSYITSELPDLVMANLPVNEQCSIMGHSMGGHGALMIALRNPGKYASVSAFAPICHPMACPWGEKAFSGYLGTDNKEETWAAYDSTELASKYVGPPLAILIDQGKADGFLEKGQLLPDDFIQASAGADNITCALRMHDGYDHSYYFIASFVEDHLKHHAQYLKVSEE
eukprot:UC1_evm1s1850